SIDSRRGWKTLLKPNAVLLPPSRCLSRTETPLETNLRWQLDSVIGFQEKVFDKLLAGRRRTAEIRLLRRIPYRLLDL
ncbi:MAG: hypothetical protein RL122_1528, partial [Pseudomonadota bacterium]